MDNKELVKGLNDMFDLIKESRTAVRQLGWKSTDYSLPHEWRMLALRYERGEFQIAMDRIHTIHDLITSKTSECVPKSLEKSDV